jgi:hypothetical protein
MFKHWLLLCICFFVVHPALAAQDYRVGDHELFIMSTGDMMPKGTSCFTDYELFLLKYTYAPTDNTHFGILMPFPIVTEAFEYATGHVKHRYLNTPTFKSAAFATFTAKEGLFTLGNVITMGKAKTNFNLEASYCGSLTDSTVSTLIYMLGIRHRISAKASLMVEYINAQNLINRYEYEDIGGVLNFGLRLQFRKVSLDIGGIRPLRGDTGSLLLLPFLKVSLLLN